MRVGERLAGRFELEREIGAGGMGSVWRARDATDGATVALKVILPGAPLDRFVQESALLGEIEHPGIIRYVAHGLTDGGPYLAMEWVDGEGLDARLARGPLGVEAALALGVATADALAAAHARGVVHRDLKPSNLLLQAGDPARPKLIDFGIARAIGDARALTRTGVAMGTPGYMAPEQARGEPGLDARADVFSLGCVLFECVTGRPAFSAEHVIAILAKILVEDPPLLGDVVPTVPYALEELVSRMLSKERGARPSDGAQLAAELRAVDASPRSVASGRASSRRLTAREQRFVAIVLRGQASTTDAATLDLRAPPAPTLPAARSVADASPTRGARVEPLAGGGMVVLVSGEASATDLANRAASYALALSDGTSVAVATGRAEVDQRLPVGDAIDRAARLVGRGEGAAWIDATSVDLLREGFVCEVRGDAAVILGRRDGDAERTLLGRPTPCVGREAWLAALVAMFDETASEPVARAAVVVANPGIGKSRLRQELVRRLRARDDAPAIWFARGDIMAAAPAFGLVAQLVRGAAGLFEREPLDVRRDKLRALVARRFASDRRASAAAFVGEMVGARARGEEEVAIQGARRDPVLMAAEMRAAWEELLDAETREHPVVLVLEDLQWGDAPSVGLVDAALERLSRRSLFVLALARPTIDQVFPNLWSARNVERIELPPLPRAAAEKLARSVLGAGHGSIGRIVELAGGNAFHLEELLRAVAEGRGDRLPDTVLASVEARIGELDDDARRALRAASVFGEVFWAGGVRALAGERPAQRLGLLERHELVTRTGAGRIAGETQYAFRHALLREAAYAMLVDDDRALGHRLVAAWLSDRGWDELASIAEHFERGHDPVRAADAFGRAAERALDTGDFGGALALAGRASATGAEGRTLGRLRWVEAKAHLFRGENLEARDRADEALALLDPDDPARAEAQSELALALVRIGDVERFADVARSLLELVSQAAPPEGVLYAAARTAGAALTAGAEQLGQALIAAIGAAPGCDSARVRGRVLDARGIAAWNAGRLAEACADRLAAIAAYDAVGDVRTATSARVNVGSMYVELGRFDESAALLDDALAVGRRLGLASVVTSAAQNLGRARAGLGQRDEAARLEREAIAGFEAQGRPLMASASRTYLAAMLTEWGELGAAEDEARRALVGLERAPWMRPAALAALASALLAKGGVAAESEAIGLAEAANEELERQGGLLEEGEAEVRLVLAEARERAGDRDGAQAAIMRARERVIARAASIGDARWCATYLAAPVPARTLALAAAWTSAAG